MAGVDSGANRGQFRDPRKALFRSPDQDETSKTPGDNKLMFFLHFRSKFSLYYPIKTTQHDCQVYNQANINVHNFFDRGFGDFT